MNINTGLIVLILIALAIALTVLFCLITNGSSKKEFKKYGYIEQQRIDYQERKIIR